MFHVPGSMFVFLVPFDVRGSTFVVRRSDFALPDLRHRANFRLRSPFVPCLGTHAEHRQTTALERCFSAASSRRAEADATPG
jgi:hypothetical protein